MKTRTLFAILFITTLSLNAQIEDLSNASADRKITPKEYDFSFIKPDYSATKEIKAGLIGLGITIYNLSSYIYLKNRTVHHHQIKIWIK